MRNTPILLKNFLSAAKNAINEKGIYPHILMHQGQDGQTTYGAMDLDPDSLYLAVKKIMEKDKPVQLIMGLDRINMEGQGIDMKYDSVMTFAYYAMGMWSVGVMPYANANEVGEIQMDNKFWMNAVTKELKCFNFIEPDVSDEVVGHAYAEKICVTVVRETQMGRRYEGFIDSNKLSEKVKTFLNDKSLDINQRAKVINAIKQDGGTFEFTPEDYGFWSLKAGAQTGKIGIFPARSSKTKVYLEGVESIIEKI